MRLLRGLHNPGLTDTTCVATIGNFDGVHLGHQAIIEQVVATAKKLNVPSVAVVFEPQPMEFFQGENAPARLMRFREKFHALSSLDLDYVFCLKFDAPLSHLSAEQFIETVLVSHLNVCHLVVGDDFRFGGDRKGDFFLLCQEGKKHGFTVENTPTLIASSQHGIQNDIKKRISSTSVRALLAEGKFSEARNILGRDYSLMGRVVHGQKLGRQLGFPTANIALHRVKVAFTGVYAVKVRFDGSDAEHDKIYLGVANIGVKPTVGNFLPSLEVHFLDFSSNIYGKRLNIIFCHKLRDEQRFDNIEALKVQINNDINEAKKYFISQ